MRIALLCDSEGTVTGSLGDEGTYRLYDTSGESILSILDIHTDASGQKEAAEFLSSCRASALLCASVNAGGQKALLEKGIVLYSGVSGNADETVRDFLSGELKYDPSVRCAPSCEGGCAHCHDGQDPAEEITFISDISEIAKRRD